MRRLKLASLLLLLTVAPALSQISGSGGGRGGGKGGQGAPAIATPAMPEIKPQAAPLQRLDPGALVCVSEEALQQRQAAILARLAHQDAPAPTGCRLLAVMTPVSVIARHGPASTEVRMSGPPSRIVWTDSIVHEPPPNAR